MPKDDRGEKAVEVAVHSGAGSVGAALATAANMPELAIPMAVAASLYSIFKIAVDRRAERRFAALIDGYKSADDGSEAELEAELRERANDPAFQDATYEAFRLMADAVDGAVVPSIGRLLRLRHRCVEPFGERWAFRDVGGMLIQIDAQELQALRDIIEHVLSYPDEPRVDLRQGMGPATRKEAGSLMALLPRYSLALDRGRTSEGDMLIAVKLADAVMIARVIGLDVPVEGDTLDPKGD